MFDERIDQLPEIARLVVIFQQDAALARLMPALDLASSLRGLAHTSNMIHLPILRPIGQFAGDVTGSVVTVQPRGVNDCHLIAHQNLYREIQRVGHIARSNRRAELSCEDVKAVATFKFCRHPNSTNLRRKRWLGFREIEHCE